MVSSNTVTGTRRAVVFPLLLTVFVLRAYPISAG